MNVKTTFLNGDIDETIYIVQPENFISRDPKNIVYKFKKSAMGLNMHLDNGISTSSSDHLIQF